MPKQEVVEVKKNELAGAQQLTITPSDIDIPRLNIVLVSVWVLCESPPKRLITFLELNLQRD